MLRITEKTLLPPYSDGAVSGFAEGYSSVLYGRSVLDSTVGLPLTVQRQGFHQIVYLCIPEARGIAISGAFFTWSVLPRMVLCIRFSPLCMKARE